MCGITGFIDRRSRADRPALEAAVTAMADALVHRGPDAGGAWADPEHGVALGFRRLSIIDLTEAGHQPMTSACGRYVILFNGEIYNYRDLRAELLDQGRDFRGASDSEVLLECFAAWGVRKTLPRLIGMFAIALWDRQDATLTLIRDRLGIKPLYYGTQGGLFMFGSELKALRAHAGSTPELDREALTLYLRFNYVPEPWSIYAGIRKLEPGAMLTRQADGEIRIERYWDMAEVAAQPRRAIGEDEAETEMEALLTDAVGRRMIADVPLGALLSGGVDSSTVAALMQAQSDRPVKTFTIGFDQPGFNEAEHARAVARHLGTDHTEVTLSTEDVRALIPQMPDWYDEPFADSSALPTRLVCDLARQSVTVALSGDGGDEVFFGYTRHAAGPAAWSRSRSLPGPLRRAAACGLAAVPIAAWDSAAGLLPAARRPRLVGDKMHKLAQVLEAEAADDVYRNLVSHWTEPAALTGSAEPEIARRGRAGALDDMTERMAWLDTVGYLPGDILTKLDRASMAVALEARVPLLDHRVVELAWSLPKSLKLSGGVSKRLLRRILYRHVPAELVERPKAGFAVPLGDWLRGPLRGWAAGLFDEARLRRQGWIDPAPVGRAWREHLAGRGNHAEALWSVAMLQCWADRWLPD